MNFLMYRKKLTWFSADFPLELEEVPEELEDVPDDDDDSDDDDEDGRRLLLDLDFPLVLSL